MLVRIVQALRVIFIFYNFYNLFFTILIICLSNNNSCYFIKKLYVYILEGLRTEDKDERKVF